MNKSILQVICFLVAVNTVMFLTAQVFAEDDPSYPAKEASPGPDTNWVKHTQATLDRLKGKLALTQTQMAAWENWSRAVLTDAHQQTDRKKFMHHDMHDQAMEDETTPTRMARGIERLREENAWLQQHLTQLEAAQARTNTFYNTLSANQKTIFDLFWRDVHHQVEEHNMPEMCERTMR